MKKENIRALLEESIARRLPVALHRKKLNSPPLYCVPLAFSDELLLVALYADFQPDGYEVVRVRDISDVHSDERTAFHARIMAQEEVLPKLAAPSVPLDDFAALLAALGGQGEPVIVEDGGKTLLLGTIEKAGKSKLRMRYIGTDGQTDREPTRIAYEEIASVHFGGRYLNLVARYATPVEIPMNAPVEPPTAPPAQVETPSPTKPAPKKKVASTTAKKPLRKPAAAKAAAKPKLATTK